MLKNLYCSVSQAAIMQSMLAKELQELPQAQQWEADMHPFPFGLNRHCVDPPPDAEGRQIAANMQGIRGCIPVLSKSRSPQSRCVVAMSMAKWVSEDFSCYLVQEVGYAIRFEGCTSPETNMKYMMDSMLLRECLIDCYLTEFTIIMLGEARKGMVQANVLFGLLRKTVRIHGDMKLIVTLATLDAMKHSHFFSEAPIFTIPECYKPKEILYP
ncbi:ATP-dependent RNA helicase DHX8 [Fukomys damarensis]|uniref:ATP-dependent RNA helicase DHX8 n=1 Tax=Fukomys damarensis TaxID=885580 RepID=A0A091D756_FUKDA|nr:ATP-dependent RNA helicase DHX8 [Fukomys damarensis]